jgi:tRNA(fMet)-specific endonuclease VapC
LAALVDTSIFIQAERVRVSAADQLRFMGLTHDEPVALAAITAAELLLGVELADDEHRSMRGALVEDILGRWPIVPFDLPAARVLARLRGQLKRAGVTIGRADLEVAATAMVRDWQVITLDRADFERIPGLRVMAPSPSG